MTAYTAIVTIAIEVECYYLQAELLGINRARAEMILQLEWRSAQLRPDVDAQGAIDRAYRRLRQLDWNG